MEAQDCFDRLDLDDHKIVDQQVEAISAVKAKPFVFDGKGNLPAHTAASQLKFPLETGLIDGFKEAWSQGAMNLQTRIDDQPGHGVGFCRGFLAHLAFFLGVLAVLFT